MTRLPSEEDVIGFMTSLSNWGRWGPDDQLGTANLITPAKRVEAAGLVTEGRAVSLALPMATQYPVGGVNVRFMTKTGLGLADPGRKPFGHAESERVGTASEYIGTYYHGIEVTHVDALSHMFFDARMYNDKPAALVTPPEGATHHAMSALPHGIVSRGILLDVPATKGVPWLDAAVPVLPTDLQAAETRQGVQVEEGDVVLLRTGNGHRRAPDAGTWRGFPGWHAACLPWMHERGVAAIGHDGPQEVFPSGYPNLAVPVHTVGIVAMGLWLVDNLDLEEAAIFCAERRRWDFQFVLAPLRLEGATGSPANPLAVF